MVNISSLVLPEGLIVVGVVAEMDMFIFLIETIHQTIGNISMETMFTLFRFRLMVNILLAQAAAAI